MEFAIGNFLRLRQARVEGAIYRWQNFHIQGTVDGYSFVPFGFSGVTVNRQGDNVDASLVFPNNELSRQWAVEAIRDGWLAVVKVMLLDPGDPSQQTELHTYAGQIAQGAWDETSLNLRLNTVLDAVGGEIPVRRLTKSLVGNLPTSSNVRLG